MKAWKGGGSGRGLFLGVGLTVAAAAVVGAGRTAQYTYHVTSSADGRMVHLWSANGAQLRYLASAAVPDSKVEPRDGAVRPEAEVEGEEPREKPSESESGGDKPDEDRAGG